MKLRIHRATPSRFRSRTRVVLRTFVLVAVGSIVLAQTTDRIARAEDSRVPAPQKEDAPPTGGDARIELTNGKASWDNLSELFLGNTPAAAFGEGSVFVMRGELRNKGEKDVHHVVLRYELLDAAGNVVHDAEGYNRSAESMRPDEEGTVRAERVVPLAPGAVDHYRMVFFHDEVPRFASQRVRVVEVHEQAPAGGPTKASTTAPARGAAPAAQTAPAAAIRNAE